MKIQSLVFLSLLIVAVSAPAEATVVVKTINYQHGGTPLQGVLAYDDAVSGKRPGILVVHEWWGLNDYVKSRVRQLAELGYVAFALDMYGRDKVTDHPKQASEWMKTITANGDFWRERAIAGLAVLKSEERTDADRVAAIGYCFGGATVQQVAYGGANVRGVVSFHGALIPPPDDAASRVSARILIAHGASDPMNPPDKVQSYITAMDASGLGWQMNVYGGALHGFTNPGAGRYGLGALGYNRAADQRSWAEMQRFFDEIFQ